MTDIDTIRERHWRNPDGKCASADHAYPSSWPCDTRIVLDEWDKERGEWMGTESDRADADRLAEALQQVLPYLDPKKHSYRMRLINEALRLHEEGNHQGILEGTSSPDKDTVPTTPTGQALTRTHITYTHTKHRLLDGKTLADIAVAIEGEAKEQERERLRGVDILGDWPVSPPYPLPEWVKTPTPKGEAPIDLLEDFRTWLLAEPDDE